MRLTLAFLLLAGCPTEEIDLTVPAPAKYFLLWFNKAAEANDQYGGYQVEISDIELLR